jgi:hypothetical protein
VFAFLSASQKGERLSYRGYTLEISKDQLGWRLKFNRDDQICPSSHDQISQ